MNIYQKLAAIRDKVKYVQKTGENKFHKYTYAKEGDYLDAIRPALSEYGVVCHPSSQKITNHPTNPEIVFVEMEYTFVNIDNPEEKVVVPCAGEGSDKGDKALYKGITGAKKYMLSTMFLIATGDDAEADEDTDKRASSAPKPTALSSVPAPKVAEASSGKKPWRSLKAEEPASADGDY